MVRNRCIYLRQEEILKIFLELGNNSKKILDLGEISRTSPLLKSWERREEKEGKWWKTVSFFVNRTFVLLSCIFFTKSICSLLSRVFFIQIPATSQRLVKAGINHLVALSLSLKQIFSSKDSQSKHKGRKNHYELINLNNLINFFKRERVRRNIR